MTIKIRNLTILKSGNSFRRPPGHRGIPILGNLLQARKDPLRFAEDLVCKYGDIVFFRIGIFSGYLLNHPEYFKHVLISNHRNYNKKNYNYRMLKPVLGEGLITANDDRWLNNRRIIQPAFHTKQVNRFGSITVRIAGGMMENWESHADRGWPIELTGEMMKLTLKIIAESLFSINLESETGSIGKSFTALNEDMAYRFKNVFVAPRWIPTRRNRKFREAKADLNRQVYGIISQRRSKKQTQNDLLDMLLEARYDNSAQGMSDRQLRDEVMTLMLAGHETTANLISWTCYLLSEHPSTVKKLKTELKCIPDKRDPVPADVSSLKYTKAILQESLRLYPPVWIISRKAIGRDSIGRYTIPPGTTVTLCSYLLHRHPAFWKDAEKFIPERFLPVRETEPLYPAYFPFGGGPRSCIGSHFAMMEAQLILAMIYRRYSLELLPGHPVVPEPLITLRPRYGLKMLLKSD